MRDGSLVVGDILDVRSEVDHPDYYIVRLDDRVSGEPAFMVCVSKDGWVLAATRAEASMRRRLTLVEADKALGERFGATKVRYVYAWGNIQATSSPFSPMVGADTDGGRVYVSQEGEVWREESVEPRPTRPVSNQQAEREGTALAERLGRESVLLKKGSISRMVKIGSWRWQP